MKYLSKNDRHHNFELADEHLKHLFSKYPLPKHMESCSHCSINEDDLARGDFNTYIAKAITTWGSEGDFKHYLPQLLAFAYLEKKCYDSFIFASKLNHVKTWGQDEIQAINSWFYAYLQCEYINKFEDTIQKSRSLAQSWMDGHAKNLCCEFPLSVFFKDEFEEIESFLHTSQLTELSSLLELWPHNQMDLIVFSSCLTKDWIIDDIIQVFGKDKTLEWLLKNEKIIEEKFWKTSNTHSQKLFSDALETLKLMH